MNDPDPKYTLMWIPASGLFYRGGEFFDGQGNQIRWDRTLRFFKHSRAETVRERMIANRPEMAGELVMIKVVPKDTDDL